MNGMLPQYVCTCACVYPTIAHLHDICITALSQNTTDDVWKEKEGQLMVIFEGNSTNIKNPSCPLVENLPKHMIQYSNIVRIPKESLGEC